nr:inosine triphosphate pyrophosphatase [Ipomoea batatas]
MFAKIFLKSLADVHVLKKLLRLESFIDVFAFSEYRAMAIADMPPLPLPRPPPSTIAATTAVANRSALTATPPLQICFDRDATTAASTVAFPVVLPRPVTFVTGKAKKLKEVRAILGTSIPFQSLKLDQLPAEPEEISKEKARIPAKVV